MYRADVTAFMLFVKTMRSNFRVASPKGHFVGHKIRNPTHMLEKTWSHSAHGSRGFRVQLFFFFLSPNISYLTWDREVVFDRSMESSLLNLNVF